MNLHKFDPAILGTSFDNLFDHSVPVRVNVHLDVENEFVEAVEMKLDVLFREGVAQVGQTADCHFDLRAGFHFRLVDVLRHEVASRGIVDKRQAVAPEKLVREADGCDWKRPTILLPSF